MFCFRLLTAALLAAALSCPALAQTAAPSDSTRAYQHQLGLTVSPQFGNLFTRNQVLPLGLLYKYQVRPNRAWRVRLTGYYSRHDTATAGGTRFLPDANNGPDARVWEVNMLVGYEWQHQFGGHWQWHYGLEVGGGYRDEYKQFASVPYYYPPGAGPDIYTETGSRYLYRWQVQGRGFAGLSYALTSRVRVYAETAIVLSYKHQKSGGSYKSIISNGWPSSPGATYSEITHRNIIFSYQPVQVLGLSVCF